LRYWLCSSLISSAHLMGERLSLYYFGLVVPFLVRMLAKVVPQGNSRKGAGRETPTGGRPNRGDGPAPVTGTLASGDEFAMNSVELRRNLFLGTSENSVQAKFREFSF
jgi:hypothetical protein